MQRSAGTQPAEIISDGLVQSQLKVYYVVKADL